MARYSLDTNMISYILREDQRVNQRFRAALVANHEFIICPVVYYELKRGLLRKDAHRQIERLEQLVALFDWHEFERNAWQAAAQAWADARQRGRSTVDADLLIACHAQHFSAIIVTANHKDFEHFPVTVVNWAA